MNAQPLEQLYQNIANGIVQSIDEKWSSAWITVEVVDNNVFKFRSFYSSVDDKTVSIKTHPLVRNSFMEIWKEIRKDDSNPWTHARFDLQPDGNFAINFDYKDSK